MATTLELKELTKLDRDQFAKFIAHRLLSIDNYNFDVLYDIKKIVELSNERRSLTPLPAKTTFHLMIRSTGSDMIKPDDENYSIYDDRTSEVYSLEFCWNCDYQSNTPFCIVSQLR